MVDIISGDGGEGGGLREVVEVGFSLFSICLFSDDDGGDEAGSISKLGDPALNATGGSSSTPSDSNSIAIRGDCCDCPLSSLVVMG